MRLDGFDAPRRRKLPYADSLVVGAGEEELARGVEHERADPVVVPGLWNDWV